MKNEIKDFVLYVPCRRNYCKISAEFSILDNSLDTFRQDLSSFEEKYKKRKSPKEILERKIESRRCPDALSMYKIGAIKKDKVDSMTLQVIKKGEAKILDLQSIPNIKSIPKIILVLESPHIDEYRVKSCSKDNNCSAIDFVRPAPARGVTGVNIKGYLPKIFASEEFKEYKVAIVNPIQYQCSLGGNDKKLKDEFFCNLLRIPKYESCFRNRLELVYNPQNDLLINCCTKGDNRKLVWDKILLVWRGIRGENAKFPLLQMNHPSSWSANCRNRCVQIVNQIDGKMIAQKGFFCEKDYADLWGLLNHTNKGRGNGKEIQ